MITRITDAYVRHYTDNGTYVAYVEWVDEHNHSGRTEGPAESDCQPVHSHMAVLFARATRQGVETRLEHW